MSDNTHKAPERIWVDYWLTGKKPRQVTEEDLGGCTEYVRADRIEELEAELAKAVGALHEIAGKKTYADDPWGVARATLAELKGQDDAI